MLRGSSWSFSSTSHLLDKNCLYSAVQSAAAAVQDEGYLMWYWRSDGQAFSWPPSESTYPRLQVSNWNLTHTSSCDMPIEATPSQKRLLQGVLLRTYNLLKFSSCITGPVQPHLHSTPTLSIPSLTLSPSFPGLLLYTDRKALTGPKGA